MKPVKDQTVSFQAEVVEIFEKDGRRVAKVMVHSFFLEVDADRLPGAHLGDSVILKSGGLVNPAPGHPVRPPRPVKRRGQKRRS